MQIKFKYRPEFINGVKKEYDTHNRRNYIYDRNKRKGLTDAVSKLSIDTKTIEETPAPTEEEEVEPIHLLSLCNNGIGPIVIVVNFFNNFRCI
jgi:hypothetical protein